MRKSLLRIAVFGILLSLPAEPLPEILADARSARPPTAPGFQIERVFLVLVDVVVTDASGRPVRDLRPDEFTLRVDGHGVRIRSVDLQVADRGETVIEPQVGPSAAPGAPSSGHLPAEVTARPVSRPRGIVLFFDGLDSERGLSPVPIESARRFLKEGLQPGDEVMLIGLGRRCRIYREFTPDLSQALQALDEIEHDPGIRMGGERHFLKNLEAINELRGFRLFEQADALGRSFAEEDRRRASRLTLALEALSEVLRTRPGRKEVFLFSDGFPSSPGRFYGISDTRGVETDLLRAAQGATASQTSLNLIQTQGLDAYRPGTPQDRLLKQSVHSLAAFSLNSGGVLTHGINRDFQRPMRRIEEQSRATYLLSYEPEGQPDGKLHPVQVKVSREGVKVRAPEGFVWMTAEQRREQETRSAYFAPDLFRKIPLAMEGDAYLGPGGEPGVEMDIAVPCDALLFLPGRGHRTAKLEAGFVLESADGKKMQKPVGGRAEVHWPGAAAGPSEDLTLRLHRLAPPGEYRATAVVRDLQSGDVGALQATVKIPDLQSGHLAMSSLILSRRGRTSRAVDLGPSDGSGPELPALPAVGRTFTSGDQVVASALVYHPSIDPGSGEARVTAFAQIHHEGSVLRHLQPARRRVRGRKDPAILTLKIPVDLKGLEPGVYELEVEAWDEVEKRGVVQHVEFLIR